MEEKIDQLMKWVEDRIDKECDDQDMDYYDHIPVDHITRLVLAELPQKIRDLIGEIRAHRQ